VSCALFVKCGEGGEFTKKGKKRGTLFLGNEKGEVRMGWIGGIVRIYGRVLCGAWGVHGEWTRFGSSWGLNTLVDIVMG